VRVPLRTYAWTTGVEVLPLGAMLTFFGSRMGRNELQLGIAFWAPNVLFLALVLTIWWIFRRRNARIG